MIWSSARPHNVEAMCDQLFTPEQRQRLLGVWGRDRLGLSEAQYDSKLQVYKRLSAVWAGLGGSHRHGWGQHNTVLLDDSALKASSEPFSVVVVPEFVSDAAGGNEERVDVWQVPVLTQVAGYLQCLHFQADVSSFMRTSPFAVGRGWEQFCPGAVDHGC